MISLGAGVQSSALLLMAAEGELQHLGEPRLAIFADTGWEPSATYEWLGFLRLAAWKAGIEIATASRGNLRDAAITASEGKGRWASMPVFIKNSDGSKGRLPYHQCSREYKIEPSRRELRHRGFSAVEMWMGITVDEIGRVKDSDVQWASNRYPLIEMEMSRFDCERWLADHGYPQPPKSACIGCPFTRNPRWFDMRENRLEEWADAVEADRALRHMPGIKGECYLHSSLVPLSEAIIDPSDYGQLELQGECEGVCFV